MLTNDIVFYNWALMSLSIIENPKSQSAQSLQDIFPLLIHSAVSHDTVFGYSRLRSDCVNVQADLGLNPCPTEPRYTLPLQIV